MAKKKQHTQGIEIRPLNNAHDIAAFETMQHENLQDGIEGVISQHMLISIAHNGGLVLGAFEGKKLVGGAVAFLAAASDDPNRPAMANLKLYSKRIIVQDAYRNRGIGYHLKLAQYQFCQQRGIRMISWMFDPLLSVNAYLGLRKLGAIVSGFYPQFYGNGHSDALPGESDRFQADWWLTSGRAKQRIRKGRAPLTLKHYLDGGTRVLNESRLAGNLLPEPGDEFIVPQSALGLIEIPSQFAQLQAASPDLATAWREHTRTVFGSMLGEGFVLTDFVFESYQGRMRSFYVCSRESSLRQLDRNFNQN